MPSAVVPSLVLPSRITPLSNRSIQIPLHRLLVYWLLRTTRLVALTHFDPPAPEHCPPGEPNFAALLCCTVLPCTRMPLPCPVIPYSPLSRTMLLSTLAPSLPAIPVTWFP